MIRMTVKWSLWIAPLLLWGCMLPQPDTPIIPPFQVPVNAPEGGRVGAPMAPTTEDQTGLMAVGMVSGRVDGTGVTAITAVPVEKRGTQESQAIESAGGFNLALAEGDYQLEVTVDGQPVRSAEVISVKVGEHRTFVVTVHRDPLKVTVAETTVREEPPATPENPATP